VESIGIWEGNYVQTAIWGRRGQRLQPAIIKKGPTSCTAPLLAASSSVQSQELTSRSAVQNRKQSQQRLLGATATQCQAGSKFDRGSAGSFPPSLSLGSPVLHDAPGIDATSCCNLLAGLNGNWKLGLCFHLPQTAFIPQFPIETIPPSLCLLMPLTSLLHPLFPRRYN
jgi:hypothetical protein